MKSLLIMVVLFALTVSAADISGTWKGTAETPNGAVERTFVFKVDGDKLTGDTTSEMMGKSTIMDGKVDGDSLSFWIKGNFQGEEVKINYKGKVAGDQMKLTGELPDAGFTVEYTAKKVS